MEAQHEEQRPAAQTDNDHAFPQCTSLFTLPISTYERLQRDKVCDPPATPGKAPSIALALAASPGHTNSKMHGASREAEGHPVANMVASTHMHAHGVWTSMPARSVQRRRAGMEVSAKGYKKVYAG